MTAGFILVLTGLLVGLMSSFFGLGGGVLIVPSLTFLFPQLESKSIIAISLGIISLNTALNIFLFWKIKLLPKYKEIISIFGGCLIGAAVGFQVLSIIDQKTIKLIFAICLLLSIIKNLISFKDIKSSSNNYSKVVLFFIALIGSVLSAITGLGGGIIFVPLLINVLKIPAQKIPPYSNVAMFFACSLSVIPHLLIEVSRGPLSSLVGFGQLGRLDLIAVIVIFIGAAISSKFGASLNLTIKPKTKTLSLNILLIFLAIKLILEI